MFRSERSGGLNKRVLCLHLDSSVWWGGGGGRGTPLNVKAAVRSGAFCSLWRFWWMFYCLIVSSCPPGPIRDTEVSSWSNQRHQSVLLVQSETPVCPPGPVVSDDWQELLSLCEDRDIFDRCCPLGLVSVQPVLRTAAAQRRVDWIIYFICWSVSLPGTL